MVPFFQGFHLLSYVDPLLSKMPGQHSAEGPQGAKFGSWVWMVELLPFVACVVFARIEKNNINLIL